MKKIIVIIFVFLWIFSWKNAFAEEKDLKTFKEEKWYSLYRKIIQSEDFCAQYKKTDKNVERILNINEAKYFKNLDWKKLPFWEDLKIAKKDFKKNLDDIFWCATYSSYYRTLKTIKDDLIKKNPKLKTRLNTKIQQKMSEIAQKASQIEWGCKLSAKKNNLVKKAVLNQSTYELCKYSYYLQYLRKRNEEIQNLVEPGKERYELNEVTARRNQILIDIDSELDKTLSAYPMALQAYNDFENNIWSHILLELLKEDYKVLRLWIHKTLNPINQVIYKISNAMRK